MKTSLPTRGQLERELSQKIQSLYREQLGHQPGKITCQIFEQKIAIIIENSLTAPEQLLAREGRTDLVAEVRADLNDVIRPQLRELIEEALGVSVLDLLADATLETERSGIIAILSEAPQFRTSKPTPSKDLNSSSNALSD